MAESKIALWVDKLLKACNGSKEAAGAVKGLTSGPVIFTEKDFAEYLEMYHPDISAKIELEQGFLNIHASYSIFGLTFVCTSAVDPSGRIAYLRQEKGPALKNFLDIEGTCDRIECLDYDNSSRTISLDLSNMPKDVNLKAFEIKKGCMEVELRREAAQPLT